MLFKEKTAFVYKEKLLKTRIYSSYLVNEYNEYCFSEKFKNCSDWPRQKD